MEGKKYLESENLTNAFNVQRCFITKKQISLTAKISINVWHLEATLRPFFCPVHSKVLAWNYVLDHCVFAGWTKLNHTRRNCTVVKFAVVIAQDASHSVYVTKPRSSTITPNHYTSSSMFDN